jgi:ABC-2 type transport system permease protein
MREAFFIGLKDLRLRLRDRSAIIVAFVAPLALATIISFAFGNFAGPFKVHFAVADLDHSNISASFVKGLSSIPSIKGFLTAKTAKTAEEARALTNKGKVGGAFIIPKGFGQAVGAGNAEVHVVRSTEQPVSGEVAEAIAKGFVAEVNAGRLSVATVVASGALAKPGAVKLAEVIQKAVAGRIPVSLADGPVGARAVTTASYFGPSMAIFFLFFTVQFGALGIMAERREGTLARLLAAPIRPAAIVAGKVASSFALGLVSMVSMIAATSLLLGATWGDPLAVAALVVAIVLAAMGVTGLVITLAKTIEQAQGFGAITATGLALLGGNFIQIATAPKAIRTLSLLTPNGWALHGFVDLASGGGGITTILPALGAVLAFAIVTGGLALLLGRRLVAA